MSNIHSNQGMNCLLKKKKLKNPKAFIDYSKEIDNIYENLED